MRIMSCVGIGLLGLVVGCSNAPKEPLYTPAKVGDGLKFAEGPAWDGKGNLYVSNCSADPGYVTKFDAKGNAAVAFTASDKGFKKTNGMTFHENGSLFVCDFGKKAIIEIQPNGQARTYADNYQGVPFRGPNDLAFDPNGNLYFTDPAGSSKAAPVGRVYRVDKLRNVTLVADKLAFPNGLAFSADGKHLFVAESQAYQILKYTVKSDGGLGEKTVFCKLPEEKDPDGISFDSAGNLWVAQFGAGAVRQFDRSGQLIRTVALPGKNVTNVEFGGKDMKTLYITEAELGELYRIQVETPGQKLFQSP
jgi:gluconolactonase